MLLASSVQRHFGWIKSVCNSLFWSIALDGLHTTSVWNIWTGIEKEMLFNIFNLLSLNKGVHGSRAKCVYWNVQSVKWRDWNAEEIKISSKVTKDFARSCVRGTTIHMCIVFYVYVHNTQLHNFTRSSEGSRNIPRSRWHSCSFELWMRSICIFRPTNQLPARLTEKWRSKERLDAPSICKCSVNVVWM